MKVFIDIETIPKQGNALVEYKAAEAENFSAPSSLSKKQALLDMGLDGTVEPQKYWTKDDTVKEWERRMAPTLAGPVGEEKWRKTALDGSIGEVISIAWAIEDGHIESHSRTLDMSEADFLTHWNYIFGPKMKGKQAFFIAHNAVFDLKFLFRRMAIHGIKAPHFPFRGRHGNDFYCTSAAWCEYGERVSLNNLCGYLGIEGKPDDIDGSKVWDFVRDGKIDRVVEYNMDDVDKLRQVYNKLEMRI